MITLIENGEVYAPEPLGRQSVLLLGDKIGKVGPVDRRALDLLGCEYEVIDATGCVVTPGFVDPHEHLLGGSGEKGFASQTPEISLSEIVSTGITSVVGCLGVDTTMKTMAGLLAKAKGLREEGLNAYIWTGGYNVPATSVMNSVREDIMFIDEVIGTGEIAIADPRAMDPQPVELAKLLTDTYVGGMLASKAGVTHFHVGEGKQRLAVLRELAEGHGVDPSWFYITHIERSEELMREAIAFGKRNSMCDIDTVEGDLYHWVCFWLDNGGDPKQLTISSDASITSPKSYTEQVRGLVVEHGMPLEEVLPMVTSNTARVLKLGLKGRIEVDKAADILVMQKDSLHIEEVLSFGKRLVRGGECAVRERFLEDSNRRITLHGEKAK